MKRSSDPNTWRYGGVLRAMKWGDGPCLLPMWGDRTLHVATGDILLILQTGSGRMVCGVEEMAPRVQA